jgi:hypothetical protein
MDMGPPSFCDSPVCSSVSTGWSMIVGNAVFVGWLMCHLLISASTLPRILCSRAGVSMRVSAFLL